MQSVHEIHVDLVRLLGATERLVAVQSPSADGSWEHWPRFCQYITSLDGIQSQLQARVADVTRGGGGESVDANNSGSRGTKVPSAEDLAGYNQRLEFLRRKRDDLVSAAAAAAAAADVELSEQQQQQQQRRADNYTDSRARRAGGGGGGSQSNSSDDRMEQRRQHQEATARSPSLSSHTSRNKNGNSKKYGDTRGGGGGDGLFGGRGRRHGEGAGAVGGRAADEAEADQVAQEISSMAGRLKESSMAINQTLRTQTQVLEDTGDAATLNVDRVKRENVRVAERLRKKRAAMFASWCMMITVLAIFFATYALVILPFEKRRGPFVAKRAPTFAHAAEQSPRIPSQQPDGGGGEEDPRKRAEQAYQEASRRARSNHQSANVHHRVAIAEKEAFRERQAERMVNSAQERKAAMRKKGLERQQAQIGAAQDLQEENEEQEGLSAGSCSAAPADSDDGTASTSVGSCSAPPSDDEEDVIAGGIGSCSAPPPSDGDGDVTTGDVGSCSAPPPPPDGDRDSTAADVGSCSAPPSEVDDTTATVGSCSAPPPGEADDHGAGSCSAPPSDDNSAADASSDAVGSRADPPAVDGAASIDAKKGTAAVTPRALDPMAAKAGEEYRRKAQLEYEERARRETQRTESSNAGLRLVAEEKEKYRQRQAEQMMQRATERKAKALAEKRAKAAQQSGGSAAAAPGREAEEEGAENGSTAGTIAPGGEDVGSASKSIAEGDGQQLGGAGGDEEIDVMSDDGDREAMSASDAGDDSSAGAGAGAGAVGETGNEGSGVTMPSAEAREVERRLAEEARLAYEQNSRRADESLASQNAGLRLVAEEKEKYRQRQTKNILEGAKSRRQQQQQQQGQQRGEGGDLTGAVESQSPNSGTVREEKAGQAGEDPADDRSSASVSQGSSAVSGAAAGGSGGRGDGLEAVRMRLRESLASKRGGSEGQAEGSSSDRKQ